jgi:hypothetical protein
VLGAEIHWSGDVNWIGKVLERADPADLEHKVFSPFRRWILNWRLPELYRHKGRIGGEGVTWAALSKWTLASKGTGKFGEGTASAGASALMPLVSAANKMMAAYKLGVTRTGRTEWVMTLSNSARSTSKWSPGFDYPSALHRGWKDYVVKPRPGGPGFLAWAVRPGTVIGASMGRRDTGGSLLTGGITQAHGKTGKAQKVVTDRVVAHETHPKGAPPRRHICFFPSDAQKLGLATMGFILRGETPNASASGFSRSA